MLVKSGYYPETLVINKSISLIGEDRDQTVIDAQKESQKSSPVVLITESGVTFTDFTLGNTYKPEGYGRYLMVKGIELDNYVANCYIANNRMVSIFGSAFWIVWTAYNNTIKNNILVNCSQLVTFFPTNDTNVFEGNEEVNLTDVASPFPGPSPSPQPSPTPTLTPTPTSPTQIPDEEPELSELDVILGAAITVAVLGAGLGLLIYLIKRK